MIIRIIIRSSVCVGRELSIDRMHTKYCWRCPHHIQKSSRSALDRASVIRWTTFRTQYLFPSSGVEVPVYLRPLMQIVSDICVFRTDVFSYRSPSLSVFHFETGRIRHANWYWWMAVDCGNLYLHGFYKTFLWVIGNWRATPPPPLSQERIAISIVNRWRSSAEMLKTATVSRSSI
jgi:hypothetical protein